MHPVTATLLSLLQLAAISNCWPTDRDAALDTLKKRSPQCCAIWDFHADMCIETIEQNLDPYTPFTNTGNPCTDVTERPTTVPPGCAVYLASWLRCAKCCDLWEFETADTWAGKNRNGNGRCVLSTQPYTQEATTACKMSLFGPKPQVPEGCKYWVPQTNECLTEDEALDQVEAAPQEDPRIPGFVYPNYHELESNIPGWQMNP
ncbi:hypothetical protein LTR36_009245 [Oleoguttula mirabilis]|uniref:Uncharacterized protein n=1 Tax=Oleoguttula mirabilis TaxID=1507867 RepID=A0AAV9J6Q2_9PEZI|nr:hypothetical protein LTR36_009245 [Oleoguttula mirabilis]